METTYHTMSNLFAQLGLPSDSSDIESFIDAHSPLADSIPLSAAPFWTPSQASFLQEEWIGDGDWAEVVDELNASLRARH